MPQHSFTIGICATDDGTNISRLLERVTEEVLPEDCTISDMVVVVSGSTDGTDAAVASFTSSLKCTPIVEKERLGKAEAVNRIIESMKGSRLIMVNGDALPAAGALSFMMVELLQDNCAVVCALPVPAASRCSPLVREASLFLWELHNRTMEMLQRDGEQIHLTDEMIGLNPQALLPLPEGTVNDGAYIAARAQHSGQKVGFCRNANVSVSVPSSLKELSHQRRRILFGHMKVREMTGSSPGTVEFKSLEKPVLCLRILARSLERRPAGLLVLPCLLAVEFASAIGAMKDAKSGASSHSIWKRVENAAWR